MSLIDTIRQRISQSLQPRSQGILYAEDGAAEMLHISEGLGLIKGKASELSCDLQDQICPGKAWLLSSCTRHGSLL